MCQSSLPTAPARRVLGRAARYTAAIAVCLAIVGSASAEGASAAPAPAEISGDPQSERVARLAEAALDAQAVWQDAGRAEYEEGYLEALTAAARATASEFGVSRAEMSEAWMQTGLEHQTAMLTALTQLGAPYRSNTSDPEVGFDCSGLTTYAWSAAGLELPRQSGAQISAAERREADTARAGDLAQYPGHVMIYLGVPRTFVHASNPKNDVELWMASENRAARLRYGDPTD